MPLSGRHQTATNIDRNMIAKHLFKFETNLGNFYVVAGTYIYILFHFPPPLFATTILTNFISPFSLFFFLFLCKIVKLPTPENNVQIFL